MHPKRLPLGGLAVALFLSGCAPVHWATRADAVPYCMVLGQVPVRVDGEVRCSGSLHKSCTAQSASPC